MKKTKYAVYAEYPADFFFRDMHDLKNRPEVVINRELKKAKFPYIGGSGCGFGLRDFDVYGLKNMQDVYAVKRIIRKVFKNRNIKGYKLTHHDYID